MLLQMVLTSESLATNDAGMRPNTSVNPLVSRQFFVSGERLSAGLYVALERSLPCNNENACYIPVQI